MEKKNRKNRVWFSTTLGEYFTGDFWDILDLLFQLSFIIGFCVKVFGGAFVVIQDQEKYVNATTLIQ